MLLNVCPASRAKNDCRKAPGGGNIDSVAVVTGAASFFWNAAELAETPLRFIEGQGAKAIKALTLVFPAGGRDITVLMPPPLS